MTLTPSRCVALTSTPPAGCGTGGTTVRTVASYAAPSPWACPPWVVIEIVGRPASADAVATPAVAVVSPLPTSGAALNADAAADAAPGEDATVDDDPPAAPVAAALFADVASVTLGSNAAPDADATPAAAWPCETVVTVASNADAAADATPGEVETDDAGPPEVPEPVATSAEPASVTVASNADAAALAVAALTTTAPAGAPAEPVPVAAPDDPATDPAASPAVAVADATPAAA